MTTTAVRAKVCSTCRIEKPAHEFHANNKTRDKLTSRCRDCNKNASRAYREKLKAEPKYDKACARCGRGLPYGAFPHNPLRADGHGDWCTACHDNEARRTRYAITLRRWQRTQPAAQARQEAYDPVEVGAAWQKRAACGPGDGDLFYPDSQTAAGARQTAAALEVCARCPVRAFCDADAAAGSRRYGVWAGANREPRKRKPATT